MTLTLLIVAAAAVVAAAFAVSTKSDVHAVLAGEVSAGPSLAGPDTLVGLADPAAETLSGGSAKRAKVEWGEVTLTNLTEAEAALDWAEAHGFEQRELVILGNSRFAVRWR